MDVSGISTPWSECIPACPLEPPGIFPPPLLLCARGWPKARAAAGCVMPQRRDLVEICHQRFDRFWSTSSILLMLRAKDATGYEQGGIRCSFQR